MSDSVSSAAPLSLGELSSVLAECDARLVGGPEVRVSKTSEDSRNVDAATLFVARRGERSDGTRFARSALDRGAAAVLCEVDAGLMLEPRIEVTDVRKAWGLAAHALAGRPSQTLRVVGITGTNGKTTVASLVAQALAFWGRRSARSGTLGFFVDDERLGDSLTTPQPEQLARFLKTARERGAEFAVLEVSSHALDQQRVAGTTFDVAAFTNLSQDHLDYHASMDEYAAAKARLFFEHKPRALVLNIDDAQGRTLAERLPEGFLVSASGREEASLRAVRPRFERTGIAARVVHGPNQIDFSSLLLGSHNLENLLVAWGILSELGFSDVAIADALSRAVGVDGRLERCDQAQDDIVVVVDYAHTEDALRRALLTLRGLSFSSVICVFGCGGDRDRKKRSKMGEVAALYADRIFVTSDNPRSEQPQVIADEILKGLTEARDRTTVELDRRLAIARAVAQAPKGAVVLVAGKGHEDYQLMGDQVLPFDDRVECRTALRRRRSS